MGGRSSSTFKLDKDGLGVFEGNISLENNGGFILRALSEFDKGICSS